MNKFSLPVLLAMLMLTGMTNCANAGEINRKPALGAAGNLAKNLRKGPEVKSGRERYLLLPEVRAVKAPPDSGDDRQALAAMGVKAREVLERKAHLILFRGEDAKAGPGAGFQARTRTGERLYSVVLNQRTGKLGVVLGTIQAKLSGNSDAANTAALAARYGLEIAREFPQLGRVFFQVNPGQDPFAIAQALQADGRVESAVVEILENPFVPH